MAGGLAAEATATGAAGSVVEASAAEGQAEGAMAVAVPEVGARVAEVWAAEARAVV